MMTGVEVPTVKTTAELLAHSLAFEIEASERYAELSDVMEAHNSDEVAEFFATMSKVEGIHAENLRRQAVEMNVGELPRLSSRWQSPEGPESIDFTDLHYLMSVRSALLLARHNETRAVEFFSTIAEQADTDALRTLALEMAEEEREHVQLLDDWLAKHPEDEADWEEDMDEPVGQD
jgi:rubrerythrin